MRARTLCTLGAAVMIAVLTMLTYVVGTSNGATTPMRTVLVADPAKPLPDHPLVRARDCIGRPRTCANGRSGTVLVYSLKGRAPRTPMLATVLTDENCEADKYGISHCLNQMKVVAGGRLLTVRHDHDMHHSGCLAPRERVRLVALDVFLRR